MLPYKLKTYMLASLAYTGLLFCSSCDNASAKWFDELFTGKEDSSEPLAFEYRRIHVRNLGPLRIQEGAEFQLRFFLDEPALMDMRYPLQFKGSARKGVAYSISKEFIEIAEGTQEDTLKIFTKWDREEDKDAMVKIVFADELAVEHEGKHYVYQTSVPEVQVEIANKAAVIVEYALHPQSGTVTAGDTMRFVFQSREAAVEDLEIAYKIEGRGTKPSDADDYSSALTVKDRSPDKQLKIPADTFTIPEGSKRVDLRIGIKDDSDIIPEGAAVTFTILEPGYTFSLRPGFVHSNGGVLFPSQKSEIEIPISIVDRDTPTISINPLRNLTLYNKKQAAISIQLNHSPAEDLHLPFRLSGSIADSKAYSLSPATVHFAPGEKTYTMQVEFTGEYQEGGEETLEFHFTKPDGYALAEDFVKLSFVKSLSPPPELVTKTVELLPIVRVASDIGAASYIDTRRGEPYGYAVPSAHEVTAVVTFKPHNDSPFSVRVLNTSKDNTACMYSKGGVKRPYLEDLQCLNGYISYQVARYEGDGSFASRAIRPYFASHLDHGARFRTMMYTYDFEPVRLELEIQNNHTKEKRIETLIVTGAKPEHRKKCYSEHPVKGADRYQCLYQQGIPSPDVDASDIAALRDNFPILTKAKENYDLIFREEFDNSDPANLSKRWNGYVAGSPCLKVEGGYYKQSSVECSTLGGRIINPGISTLGKFEFLYGYFEAKYQIEIHKKRPDIPYTNLNMYLQGTPAWTLHPHWEEYGIKIDNLENLAKYMGYEIDLYEYRTQYQGAYGHKYRLAPHMYYNPHTGLTPQRVDRYTTYLITPGKEVETLDIITGIEWTPEGYREFTNGYTYAHDRKKGFRLIPTKEFDWRQIEVAQVRENKYKVAVSIYYKGEKLPVSDLFVYKYPSRKPDGRLMQAAISHTPQYIVVDHSSTKNTNNQRNMQVWVDYIRVFQPRDKYKDFTPVYK